MDRDPTATKQGTTSFVKALKRNILDTQKIKRYVFEQDELNGPAVFDRPFATEETLRKGREDKTAEPVLTGTESLKSICNKILQNEELPNPWTEATIVSVRVK